MWDNCFLIVLGRHLDGNFQGYNQEYFNFVYNFREGYQESMKLTT